MTKPAPATQAQIQRAIRAVLKAGLHVKGVAPDGTVIVDSDDAPATISGFETADAEWADDPE